MDRSEYLEFTLYFAHASLGSLEAVRLNGKWQPPPYGVRTRSQFLDHYARSGWVLTERAGDVYTLRRAFIEPRGSGRERMPATETRSGERK